MPKSITIRRSLLTNLVAIVLLLGAGIFAMMAIRTRQAVMDVSGSLIQQASRRTDVKLRSFFEPVTRQVAGLRAWARSGLVQLDNPDQMRRVLIPLLEEIPWGSAVFVADDRGREFLLRSTEDGWSTREIRREEWGDRALVQEWSRSSGEPTSREERVEYDPRNRPWYLSSVQELEAAEQQGSEPGVQWTDPYSFFSTGQPGITASGALRDLTGGITVVGMDIDLIEISLFTSSIRLLDEGSVFVLTEDNRLIGVPRDPRGTNDILEVKKLLLKRPAELDSKAAHDASERLLGSSEQWEKPIRMVSEGEPWWGQVHPYQLTPDQKLLIGVAIPEDDILGQVKAQRYWVIAITLGVLALATWRAANMAKRYSRPIEELVHESERISTGDLEPGPPIASRITEIRQLAEAHDQMRAGLKTLLKLEHDLQLARQIQESALPEKLPEIEGFDLSAWSCPADETGGDSYDLIGLQDAADGSFALTEGKADRAVLLLADATGHGIGPALSVMQLRAMIRMAARVGAGLSGIAEKINQQLHADLPQERFITAWIGLLDGPNRTLTSFSAGQAPLLHFVAAEDSCRVLGSNAIPFGLFPVMKTQIPPPVHLAPGDLFAVLSDGFFEAKNPAGEELGTEAVVDVIRHHRQDSAAEILQQIRLATENFSDGIPQDDDQTLVILKRS
ncbi:MAG: SpoIIE family protein phosphatase [Thermoanaerobaculia bacterium]